MSRLRKRHKSIISLSQIAINDNDNPAESKDASSRKKRLSIRLPGRDIKMKIRSLKNIVNSDKVQSLISINSNFQRVKLRASRRDIKNFEDYERVVKKNADVYQTMHDQAFSNIEH